MTTETANNRKILSGAEIQENLRKFVKRWRDFDGTERAEAQTFINELFLCYGSDRRDTGALFEDSRTADGIMDLHWPGKLIIEMKRPDQADRLENHREQALNYWQTSADVLTERPAPQYVILCAFQKFEVWEPGKYPNAPRATFSLAELPDKYESLLYLTDSGDEALFILGDRELTGKAADTLGALYKHLLRRNAAPPETAQRFVLQLLWCLFAEDLGLLDGKPVQKIVNELSRNPERSSLELFGTLFEVLNDPEDYNRKGIYSGTRYVNGQLFAKPAKLHIEPEELSLVREASSYHWRSVDPTIFGSLMESCFSDSQRHDLGAHYTHEVDIMKIVRPTIIDPWRDRIAAARTPADAFQVLIDLCGFKVLDPACGCGNFLYVAYRELRALEADAKEKVRQLAKSTGLPLPEAPWPYFPLRNLHGLELEPVSVLITRVTLWMGHKQMTDKYGPAEPVLPLEDLSTIRQGDALSLPWPDTDCIIGNPPFLGSQYIRRAKGDAYAEWLKKAFGIGVKDYCVYWFRKTHDRLRPGQRAGLVGTNSISQNRGRKESLDYIAASSGVITDAVSTQKWPGEAKVHVSIVNWVKRPSAQPTNYSLDGVSVAAITSELKTPEASSLGAKPLAANKRHCFQGVIPVGEGFILTEEEAQSLLRRRDADYTQVVRPYLIGDDIADDISHGPRRWIIDFNTMPLEQAMKYSACINIVRDRVKASRDSNPRKARREQWWLFGEKAVGMRASLQGLSRYVACAHLGKRLLLAWQNPETCPSNLVFVFPFEDDYAMGILMSRAHGAWAFGKSSFKGDLRYTPTSTFDPFPWPAAVTAENRAQVAEASKQLVERRSLVCREEGIGLTDLYNRVEDGAHSDIRALHEVLDRAVFTAYGWKDAKLSDSEIVQRLLQMNMDITAGRIPYDPFESASGSTVRLF
ncbi:DNA methyltransferase [Streptomyces sp. NPDC007205]|uniref:DNA methyltransferase n=1 Tax=Streptomyces sp. NPDC007205 TaxID=3154316 RepID=UPI0033FFFED0